MKFGIIVVKIMPTGVVYYIGKHLQGRNKEPADTVRIILANYQIGAWYIASTGKNAKACPSFFGKGHALFYRELLQLIKCSNLSNLENYIGLLASWPSEKPFFVWHDYPTM